MSAVLTRHLFTVEDYMRMADAGVFRDTRVELVHGEIYSMPPQGNLHSIAVTRLYEALRSCFPKPWFIRIQATHRFEDDLALEPDLAILPAEPISGALKDEVPALVVEVSDSTLRYDLDTKRLIYAQSLVPEYWVVDVQANQLHVFRQPNQHAASVRDAFAFQQRLSQADVLSPIAAVDRQVKLLEVFPLLRS